MPLRCGQYQLCWLRNFDVSYWAHGMLTRKLSISLPPLEASIGHLANMMMLVPTVSTVLIFSDRLQTQHSGTHKRRPPPQMPADFPSESFPTRFTSRLVAFWLALALALTTCCSYIVPSLPQRSWTMTQWDSLFELIQGTESLIKSLDVLLGIIIWELVANISFDWSMLTGTRRRRWTFWIYMACRVLPLLHVSVVVSAAGGCKALLGGTWFGVCAFMTSSLLMMIRTVAIWKSNYVALLIATVVWLGNAANLIRTFSRVGDSYCICDGLLTSYSCAWRHLRFFRAHSAAFSIQKRLWVDFRGNLPPSSSFLS
ncbi:hypothetical protein OF83DRAFT_1089998 [Amylostereum chailletii]|nr:hypothetical protein OF83DRAFT_1089998 [Amylostereum chailletii]